MLQARRVANREVDHRALSILWTSASAHHLSNHGAAMTTAGRRGRSAGRRTATSRTHPPPARASTGLALHQGPVEHQEPGVPVIRPFNATPSGRWRPDLPDSCREPFIPLLWVKIHELLGRAPEGSTARFVKDGIRELAAGQ